ncbi:MAG: hypothetical protein ACPGEG_00605 [Salibacteraceae bacterium]
MKDPFEKISYNKKSLLAIFVQLAKSDNDIDESEERFIEDIREKLGVSVEDLKDIWENHDQYPLEPPKSERHRMTILYQLLYLTKIDGVVTQEEEDFVHTIALRLGISGDLTSELLTIVKNHIGTKIKPEMLLDTIRKHMN